jgi:hypothetical protein
MVHLVVMHLLILQAVEVEQEQLGGNVQLVLHGATGGAGGLQELIQVILNGSPGPSPRYFAGGGGGAAGAGGVGGAGGSGIGGAGSLCINQFLFLF